MTETFRLAVRLGPTLFKAVHKKSPVTSLQTIIHRADGAIYNYENLETVMVGSEE